MGSPRAPASAPRRAKMPWLCVQTVIASPSQRAMAQLGAMEAWARNGRVNSAESRWLTRAVASSSWRSMMVSTCAGWDVRKVFRSPSSGRDSRSVHRAASASIPAAVTAIRSDSAITPRNDPSRTWVSTPAGRSAAPTWSSVAPGPGGRTTRPNTMPGSTRSCRKRGRPVTLSGRSSRWALCPATGHRPGGLGGGKRPRRGGGQGGRAPGGADLAVVHRERGHVTAQLGGGSGQEYSTSLRGRLAQRPAGLLDGPAPRGHPLVGAAARADRGDPDAAQGDVEFLSRDLRERRPDALAVLDLAGPDRDRAVSGELDPVRQVGVGGERRREGALRAGGRLGGRAHPAAPGSALAPGRAAP